MFVFKSWELRNATVLAPNLRKSADIHALEIKKQVFNLRKEMLKIVPFLVLLIRYLIHRSALAFAVAAHFTGVQAHRLADFVSHKHRFERQTTQSEFLKQVSERPVMVVESILPTKVLRKKKLKVLESLEQKQ